MATKRKGTKRSRTKKKILGIQERLGVGAQGQSDVGIARGTSPGELNPLLAGLSNEELAELDRLQFNRDLTRNNPIAGVVGSLGLAGADALKALGILEPVAGAVLPALGFSEEATAEFTQPGEHTSKPSFSQAFSNLRGAGQGFQDIGRAITSQFQTGGQVPMAQDNPFGGLRIPTDFLLQQFAAGGQIPQFQTGGQFQQTAQSAPGAGGMANPNAAQNFGSQTFPLIQENPNFGTGQVSQLTPEQQRAQLPPTPGQFLPAGGGLQGPISVGNPPPGGGGPISVGNPPPGGAPPPAPGFSGAPGGAFTSLPGGGGTTGQIAEGTLQNLLQTGSPVDVSAITEAATQRGQQFFDQQQLDINESLGALGVGSSSARTAALGRAAGQAAQNIGIAGLEAGVGAEEAARNRQLGAFTPLGVAAGLGVDVRGQDLNQELGLAGLTTQRDIAAAGEAGATSRQGTDIVFQAGQAGAGRQQETDILKQQQDFLANQINAQNAPSTGATAAPGGGFQAPPPPVNTGFGGFGLGVRQTGGPVEPQTFQQGGATDFLNFLSQQAGGGNFQLPAGANFGAVPEIFAARPDAGGFTPTSTLRQGPLQRDEGPNFSQRLFATQEAARQEEKAGLQEQARRTTERNEALSAQGRASEVERADILRLAQQLGGNQASRLSTSGNIRGSNLGAVAEDLGLAALRANAGVFGLSDVAGGASAGALPGGRSGPSAAQQQLRDRVRARQGFEPRQTGGQVQNFAHGGEVLESAPGKIPGPAVPPDSVPILASGGEGIVPPDLMGALNDPASQTPEGAMALVASLRDVMNFAPGPRGPKDEGGQNFPHGGALEAQTGGQVPGQQEFRAQGQQMRDDFQGQTLGVPQGLGLAAQVQQQQPPGFAHGGQIPTQFQSFPQGPTPTGGNLSTQVPSFSIQGQPEDPALGQIRQLDDDINNARARVDNFRALVIKDGNRNTLLRSELLPQAQQELDQALLQKSQFAQLQNQSAIAQGQLAGGEAQLLKAQQAPGIAATEAAGRIGAAEARNLNLFPDEPAQQAAAPQAPQSAEEIAAAFLADPQGSIDILRDLQLRDPDLARQVGLLIAQQQGQ